MTKRPTRDISYHSFIHSLIHSEKETLTSDGLALADEEYQRFIRITELLILNTKGRASERIGRTCTGTKLKLRNLR